LFNYLFLLNKILNYLPSELHNHHFSDLFLALEFLIDEIDYKNYDIFNYKSETYNNNKIISLNYNNIPNYRTIVSELTFNIYNKFRNDSKTIPIILEKWKCSCENDPLPEVRYYWNP